MKEIKVSFAKKYDQSIIEIGGGLGKFSGKAWRIGLMGHSSKQDKVLRLLNIIGEIFKKYGAISDAAVGSQAAKAIYKI